MEGVKSSEGPAPRIEEKVAMSSPQEVPPLGISREEIAPSQAPTLRFQLPNATPGLERGTVPGQGAG